MEEWRSRRARVPVLVLSAVFLVAGVLHFVFTDAYAGIVPSWLPHPRALVLLSGACEVAGGLGLLHPRTRRAAAWGLILLLLAVWPANFQMFFDARSPAAQVLFLLRLPLQPLLMWWVWRTVYGSTRGSSISGTSSWGSVD
jgi:uncharacterized membrane protein